MEDALAFSEKSVANFWGCGFFLLYLPLVWIKNLKDMKKEHLSSIWNRPLRGVLRPLVVLVMMVLAPVAHAQSLQQLWTDVENARKADKPRTEIGCLEKIVSKAQKEKAYGHLMKAELLIIQAKCAIAPDSLAPAFKRLLDKADAQRKPVLKAVYQAVVGKAIANNRELSQMAPHASSYYYKQALADPLLLSKTKASAYEPLVKQRDFGDIYGHDLLSLIAHEAHMPEVMSRCYNAQPKRRKAAMMAAVEVIRENRYSYYYKEYANHPLLHQLDSIISRYGDLTECGEAALLKYEIMDRVKDVTDAQRYEWLKSSVDRWGNYARCDKLRNELDQMECPRLKVVQGYEYVLPGKSKLVRLPELKGVTHLKVEITRIDIGKDIQYSLTPGKYREVMQQYAVKGSHRVIVDKAYAPRPCYEVFSDSLYVGGMPAGVYVIDYITDNARLDTIHNYFHVTDIALLMQRLPQRKARLAVVHSTTGQPMEHAHIDLMRQRRQKDSQLTTVDCDAKGEYVVTLTPETERFFAYTDTDWGYREQDMRGAFRYDGKVGDTHFFNIFTDRSIYRPGQTVHMGAVGVTNNEGIHTRATEGQTVEIELRNAQGKVIETRSAVTDTYGTVHADFQLPDKGMNGKYTIKVDNSRLTFSVEEYKRPTFFVEIEKPTVSYQHGDTLTLVGRAATYSGMPVQGAKVAYKVVRSEAFRWWRFFTHNNRSEQLLEATATTGSDGSFRMRVPVELPYVGVRNYYNFEVTADVTDGSGETRQGECTLPLGPKPRMLEVDLPEKVLRDSLNEVTFTLLNAMGQPVDGTVQYTIATRGADACEVLTSTVASNRPVVLNNRQKLASGAYLLTAVCQGDTVRHPFVVFTLGDRRPATQTRDWFYVSHKEFPRDGKPVYVQVGSSDADVHVLYTIISGQKVLDMGHIELNNSVETLALPYKNVYGEGISVALCWMKDTTFYHHEAVVSRPLPQKELKMEWTTFRDKLTPGQKETWTLRVSHPDGRPANAQLMATLYDKSLDQIKEHQWQFDLRLRQHTPSSEWAMGHIYHISDTEKPRLKERDVKKLLFDSFDADAFRLDGYGLGMRILESRAAFGTPLAVDGRRVPTGDDEAAMSSDASGAEETPAAPTAVTPRTNLNETAFFYPALTTDATGRIALRFTLPEAVTTWRFMGLAHDRDMRIGLLQGEAVAAKTVMVQPHLPRFIRHNDDAIITTRLVNTSANSVGGQTLIELVDPATDKVLWRQQQPFSVGPGTTTTVAYNLSAFTHSEQAQTVGHPLICRITAQGKGFSDGEQHYLPLLPDVEMVTNTRVITQHAAGREEIDLKKLFDERGSEAALTIEYTENPAWMMVQALPAVAADPSDNAISLAATYYANSIARWLLNASPVIKRTLQQWHDNALKGNEASLTSELQKNPELRDILLEETPWVLDAQNDSENMRQLADYYDDERLNSQLSTIAGRLRQLQQADGGFAWMTGMSASDYATQAVARTLARLHSLVGGKAQSDNVLSRAMTYLDHSATAEMRAMLMTELNTGKRCYPSEFLIDYLYTLALTGAPATDLTDFVVSRLKEMTSELTIYGKAAGAVVLAHFGETAAAREFLESMIEYSVCTDEMGRYFDTRRAYSSWFDYKIPTSVACIEAMKRVDTTAYQLYIEQMQRWLLNEKRTQAWDTPVNSVNAVYAFLKDNVQSLETTGTPAQLAIDGQLVATPAAVAGTGYVKTTVAADGHRQLTVTKTSQGTSWGAVYAQFLQPVADISATQSGLTIRREVVSVNGKAVSNASQELSLKVGDRISMRITIVADRDYDFVQVADRRAACLEPVDQLSGWKQGCYVSPRDHATHYFYDMLKKGTHQMVTDYYVDRAGSYQSGTITLQCAYAPAFGARDKAITFHVGE